MPGIFWFSKINAMMWYAAHFTEVHQSRYSWRLSIQAMERFLPFCRYLGHQRAGSHFRRQNRQKSRCNSSYKRDVSIDIVDIRRNGGGPSWRASTWPIIATAWLDASKNQISLPSTGQYQYYFPTKFTTVSTMIYTRVRFNIVSKLHEDKYKVLFLARVRSTEVVRRLVGSPR